MRISHLLALVLLLAACGSPVPVPSGEPVLVIVDGPVEGPGLTVAEAMWKGRPVVASRVGGIQDQIRDGETGRLVDPGDLDGFAEIVVRLLDQPDEAARLGAAAKSEIRELFLGPRHLAQYVDLFQRLLAGAPLSSAT